MKAKNKIVKPFRRGSCRTCHQPPYVVTGRLCQKCLAFVDQDYGAQLDAIYDEGELLDLSDQRQFFMPVLASIEGEDLLGPKVKRKHTVSIFSKAGLSKRERQIVKLVFAERLTWETISKQLRLSRSSVQSYLERAIQKLDSCRAPALLSKGTRFQKRSVDHSPRFAILRRAALESTSAGTDASASSVVDRQAAEAQAMEQDRRVGLRRVCPRCRDRIFCTDRDYQYCFNCLWDSDSERSP